MEEEEEPHLEFLISTTDRFTGQHAAELFDMNLSIELVRTERMPYPGIVVKCSAETAARLVGMGLPWVKEIRLAKKDVLMVVSKQDVE